MDSKQLLLTTALITVFSTANAEGKWIENEHDWQLWNLDKYSLILSEKASSQLLCMFENKLTGNKSKKDNFIVQVTLVDASGGLGDVLYKTPCDKTLTSDEADVVRSGLLERLRDYLASDKTHFILK